MWIDTWADSGRESRPRGSLSHLYGAFLLGFLWPMILICLVQSPYLVISQDPPMCARASLSHDGFYRRGLWVVASLTMGWRPLPFWSPRTLLVRKVFLTSRMINMWSLYLLSGQGPASSLSCLAILILEYRSTGNQSPIAFPGRGWGRGGDTDNLPSASILLSEKKLTCSTLGIIPLHVNARMWLNQR